MRIRTFVRYLQAVASGVALLTTGASLATAQNTTGTIRGNVTGANGVAVANVEVSARNTENGVVRRTLSREDGAYILAGIQPATYQMSVRRIGSAPQTRTTDAWRYGD